MLVKIRPPSQMDSGYVKMNLREAVHLCELRTMPRAIRLPFHRAGDVAQISRSPSDAGRGRQVHRLEELSPGPFAVRDAHGIQEVRVGEGRVSLMV